MAAGKSSVGARLARELEWAFVDVDAVIERDAGVPIADLFGREGEASFRRREAEATRSALARDGVVIATGGGWPTNPGGGWPALPPRTFAVWLRVGGAEAVRRASSQGIGTRPLLSGADPVAAAEALVATRESAYGRAAIHVETDGREPEVIAQELARAVRGGGARAKGGRVGTNGD
jgi:shikimate kinase